MSAFRSRCIVLLGLVLCLLGSACVSTDAAGNTVPRGNQRHEFARVKRFAEQLEKGMGKLDVLLLLGSPAEKDEAGDTWVYLPERPGVLLPARALQLKFRFERLDDWGYHLIVLGQRL